MLKNIFPFLEWIGELKNPKTLKYDIIAGLTVAFVLIPQSMAYAWLAWLPIEVWLYTAFIPVLVAALFSSSRQMSTWPITIISLMTATALASFSSNIEAYIVYASLLAFFIGIFYIILSVLKLWIIVDFLSNPVIVGFTNAIAIITIISQAWKFFGIEHDKWNSFFEWIYNLIISAIQNTHIETLLYWVVSILILVSLAKFTPKLPRVLMLLVITIIGSYYLWFEWEIVETIPNSLPNFSLPFLSDYVLNGLKLEEVLHLAFFAVIIGLIGFTQSISVAKFVWTKTKQKISANRELRWQWLANISSSLFWWYWVSGSFSRTAVNLRAGAITWFSWIVTSMVVLITIVYLTPLLYYLPIVVLAAVIMIAVVELIKIRPIIRDWKTEKHDWITAVATFWLTILLAPSIEIWILIWVILSLWFFIFRSMRPQIIELSMYKDGLYRNKDLFSLKTSKHISVYRFDWALYFANASYFEDTILNWIAEKRNIKYIILDLEWMTGIDSTWVDVLNNLIDRLNSIWIIVILSSIRVRIIKKLKNYWFLKKFWKKYVFIDIKNALNYISKKEDGKIDLKPLLEYRSNKNWDTDIWRYMIKKYINK